MDWKEMFKRYMNIVGENEGVYFIYDGDWSAEELLEIDKLKAEINADDKEENTHG